MKIATWNVNGIRARFEELRAWLPESRPDVVCLQEIKASAAQVPEPLTGLPDYWSFWHGGSRGYSGVSLHVSRTLSPGAPAFVTPGFDVEHRVVQAEVSPGLCVLSVYVPNGNKNLPMKIDFLRALTAHVRELLASGKQVLVCGDLNVARTDADLHPNHRNPATIGQTRAERALFEALLEVGLTDSLRVFHPADDTLFTWWPPWREEKRKNRGWRIDYVLASSGIALRSCAILKDVGTSDHVPYVVELD